jgi:type I restriction-modification system DNA methylase subunit
MALFQTSVLKNYLKRQDAEPVAKAYKKFSKYFHNPSIQQNIRDSKEEQFQEGFLRELFVDILGYTLNPQPNFNLTTELKNEKGAKKADGAILLDGNALGVIELKSTKTKDLESIRQQAFDYKANQTGCVYVVTSNFEKLRFYINNAVEFEEFDLFTLTQNQFELLYLCLHKDNLLSNVPLKIKEASVREEEVITKKFYNDYSLFKRELFRDLVKLNMKNEVFRSEFNREDTERANKNIKHNLFKKSQKLIDRFLFIFFAEDRDLLPPNSTLKILEQWNKLKDLDAYAPLYDRFKLYFGYLDTGRKGTDKGAEIFAYNGGLFKPDPILDSLQISDELLFKHTEALSKYDFESQVDVNILGHIFENSLNEIESVNAEIEGVEFDKQKTKRKKDGVFYTPKYITKYIVDNTVGKLCEEKKTELNIIDEEYTKNRKGRTTVKLKELRDQLEDYRNWLLQITICDPACGSGAFLNQALDFLIKEHQYIDELQTSLLGGGLVFPDIENTVLENNIFGVDLNEESVEIAKLSLWLRTAQPRRKLNDLSSNIKCGNSLIDDPKVAGDKAFKWQNEFPQIFAKGGFDVVIGNPPYGAKFNEIDVKYYNKTFEHQSYQLDSFLLFTEKLPKWIKSNGLAGYIMPNTWLSSLFGKNIREFVFNNLTIIDIVHYGYFVFEDATVETDIYIFRNNKPDKKTCFDLRIINKDKSETIKEVTQIEWINLNGEPVNIYQSNDATFIKKKLSKLKKLGDLVEIVQGTKPFQKGKGKPAQTEETMELKPFISDVKKDESFRPLLRGSLINRYCNFWEEDYWISYGDWLAEPRYSANFDAKEKIVIRQTGDSLIATYDNSQFIARDNLYVIRSDGNTINIKSLLALLNSKFLTWYFQNIINSERGKAMAQVKRGHIEILPVVEIGIEMLEEKVNTILRLNSNLISTISIFDKMVQTKYSISEFSIGNLYQAEFKNFLDLLKKNKVQLSLSEEAEWMQYFNEQKQKAQTLKTEIDKTDKEIDKMVYQLYGLTDEEIKIVEGS